MKSLHMIAAVLLVASTVSTASAARAGQRSLLDKGKGTHFLVGIMDHFSKSHHDSYSNPTIIAAQPTIVYAPMPQLDPTIVAPQPTPMPEPVKSKTASITFGDKFGKSATITFTKTIPDHNKILEHLGLEDEETPAPVPVPPPQPVPMPIPNPVPVPVPVPTPVPVQPLPGPVPVQPVPQSTLIAAQPQQIQLATAPQQQFVAAQPQFVAAQPQYVAAQPQYTAAAQYVAAQLQMPYAGSYVASQPQTLPTYVPAATPMMPPNTWGHGKK